MKQWYVLHTKPRVEKRVAQTLGQYGIETFLPEAAITTQKKKGARVPFFPGYLFLHVDMKVDNPAHWRWTPGVRYVVAYGERPAPIPDEVITLIRHKLAELENQGSKPAHPFEAGDIVKIKSGPFKTMLGIFDGPTTPSERVHVLLFGLNNSARLRIAPSALEKATESTDELVVRRPRRTRGRGRRINIIKDKNSLS